LNAALKNDHTPTQEVVIAERDCQVFVQKVVDVGGDVIGLSLVTVDVTEQKHIIRKLHLSDAHFRHLAEVSPTIAWAARPDGTVDYISPLATDMEGEAMQRELIAGIAKCTRTISHGFVRNGLPGCRQCDRFRPHFEWRKREEIISS
jgi:PAS domain-containing protein